MGLIASHDAYQGSYDGFGRWRRRIAELGGYPIIETDFYHGYLSPMTDIDFYSYPLRNFSGKWNKDERPKDPLIYLIIHHDDEGSFTPFMCRALADRLDGILKDIDGREISPDDCSRTLHSVTAQFIEGLRLAQRERRRLIF